MSEVIPGALRVSNDCLADLVGYVALECYGVVGMASLDGQSGAWRLLPANRLRKGIDVAAKNGRVFVTLHVIIEQGINISTVTANLVSSVKFILKQIARLADCAVEVHVEDLRSTG